ncbi:hypothetical protein ACNFJ7_03730 [Sphingomonas sp. HT-1]|jgi:hypothetical protein|uniref:hypothetical protein n=1 Tax=unclassified Sphingomonas TaxID=196159 RepID=UPI0003031392|nr:MULTISPECIES: hypothetical protein [unclassified Sphingomonas]KTF69236.1 hypothetical protein ATB93_10265 [Sphingomonas sp. WG]
MSPNVQTLVTALPTLQPDDPGVRLLLFGIRQTGANGLNDASTAHAFVVAFGKAFRRPLLLLRTLMQEMSAMAAGPVQIGPWCCPRMTTSEACLIAALAKVRTNPAAAALLLADVIGVRDARGLLPTAHALAESFADLALPLEA